MPVFRGERGRTENSLPYQRRFHARLDTEFAQLRAGDKAEGFETFCRGNLAWSGLQFSEELFVETHLKARFRHLFPRRDPSSNPRRQSAEENLSHWMVIVVRRPQQQGEEVEW